MDSTPCRTSRGAIVGACKGAVRVTASTTASGNQPRARSPQRRIQEKGISTYSGGQGPECVEESTGVIPFLWGINGGYPLFGGRPLGRIVDCRPRASAVASCQVVVPKGVPRLIACRTASVSESDGPEFTKASQSWGCWTGRSERGGLPSASAGRECRRSALLQGQSCALSTSFARTGLRSTYRHTVRRWLSLSTGKDLYAPW